MNYQKIWECMEELFQETERLRQENQELRNELHSSQNSVAFWSKRYSDLAQKEQEVSGRCDMDDMERSDTF